MTSLADTVTIVIDEAVSGTDQQTSSSNTDQQTSSSNTDQQTSQSSNKDQQSSQSSNKDPVSVQLEREESTSDLIGESEPDTGKLSGKQRRKSSVKTTSIDPASGGSERRPSAKKTSLLPAFGGLARRLSAKRSSSALGGKSLLRKSHSRLNVLAKEFAEPIKTIEELRRDEGVRDMVSVTRVLSASSERRRPKSAAKGSGQVELYILSDELDDVAKTINKLKTEMAHTCIKAFLKPHVYMINISWAPRNLYRHGPDTSFGNPFSEEDISFTDAVLYITKELRPLVKKSQIFLPTLATCIGTVKKKILVLELKPGIHAMNEEKPRTRLSKS